MSTPPKTLIDSKGKLTSGVIKLLHENFGFSIKSLERTVYKQISFHKNAITIFNHVYYDAKCFNKSEIEWLLLIIHEQVHREEIGNHFQRAISWYAGYLIGFMKAGFSYRKNPYEERAYSFEAKAAEILKKL